MRLSIMDFASLGILGCAVALTSVVVKREFFEAPPQSAVRKVARRAELNLVGRVLGSKDAPVPIVVFADFQCPYCARAQTLIQETLAKHEGRVKVLYRHLPFETIHPHAWAAAIASECAAAQGAFSSYHDLLYAKQDSIGKIPWSDLATRAGVDTLTSFQACLESDSPRNVVERDVLLARQLRVDRTPAFIVGDEMYAGLPTAQWLEKQIARELRRASRSTASIQPNSEPR